MKPLNEWLGYWNADLSTSSASVPNLGSGGMGGASNNLGGLVRVVGPAIYPGPDNTANQVIGQDIFVWPSNWRITFILPPWLTMGSLKWGAIKQFIGNVTASGGGNGYSFRMNSNNEMVALAHDGGNFVSTACAIAINPLSNGFRYEITGNTMVFSQSLDFGETWIQIGSPVSFTTSAGQGNLPLRWGFNGADGYHCTPCNPFVKIENKDTGLTVFEIKPEDIPSDVTATSFISSSGHTINITRVSTEQIQVPVIVPAGKTVFINPDASNNNNNFYIVDHADFDVNHTWGHFTFDGNAANFLSVPDAAPLDIVGDIDLVGKITVGNIGDGLQNWIIGKYHETGNQRGYGFYKNGVGGLTFIWSTDGTGAGGLSSGSNVSLTTAGLSNGQVIWVRVTLDVDDGAGNRVTKFYYALDQEEEPTSWTQLGTDIIVAGTTSIFNCSEVVVIGGFRGGAAGNLNGRVYRAIIRNGIGGTVVLDIGRHDIPAPGSPSFTCKTGQTVTINGTVPITPRSGEDAILFWVGQKGNGGGGARYHFRVGATGMEPYRLDLRTNTASSMLGAYNESGQTAITTPNTNPGNFNNCVHFVYLNRATNTLVKRSYTPSGTTNHSQSAVTAGGLFPTAIVLMSGLPGTVYSWGWDKGVGVIPSNAEMDELAASLLSSSMAAGDYLDFSHDFDPDFSQKDLYLQPNTQRSRSYYRSPLASQELNLQHNSISRDISYLYERFEELGIDIEDEIQDIYEDGIEGIEFDETIKGINGLLLDVKNLRKQIEELKKPL